MLGPAKEIGECLEPYRAELQRRFGIALPPFAVTVYPVVRLPKVRTYALRLHKLVVAPGTIAYSVYDDLSIVGPASSHACGTLAHELVHLMIRRSFGNSPPWLEEGLASEVAVASLDRTGFTFRKSWRDDMLRREFRHRPTVAALLGSNWSDYLASNAKDLHRVAALHAMAAVFVRYLDAQKKLNAVYDACRDQRFDASLEKTRPYAEIVSSTLEAPLDEVDASFVKWFRSEGAR